MLAADGQNSAGAGLYSAIGFDWSWRCCRHRGLYVQQGLFGPTVPNFWVYNPAYAQVQNEHVFPNAWVAIMKDGLTPQAAADKAFKRVEEIFAQYPIVQG